MVQLMSISLKNPFSQDKIAVSHPYNLLIYTFPFSFFIESEKQKNNNALELRHLYLSLRKLHFPQYLYAH